MPRKSTKADPKVSATALDLIQVDITNEALQTQIRQDFEQQFQPVSWQIKAIALFVTCLILAWQASAHIFGWLWEELAKPTLDRTVTKAKARAIAEFYSLLDSIVTLAIGL